MINNEAYKIIHNAADNHIDYDWQSTRIRVEYNDDNLSQDFSAVVRMKRDSILWISLQGPFGIEGARIMITHDTIRIVNKMSNEYLKQPISYLSKILPIETNISQLQDFIMGYYLLFNRAVPNYQGMEDSIHIVRAESPEFRYWSGFYPQNYTLSKSVLTDKMISQDMSVTFDGYSREQGKPFSHDRTIIIKEGSKTINIHLEYTKMKFNEALNFPFEIDPAMKEVDAIRF